MRDDLVADLAESGEAAEGDADEESLAHGAVGLLVFNQISAVDEDLGKVCLKSSVIHLKLQKSLGGLILEVGGLGLFTLLLVGILVIIRRPS